MFKVLTRIVAVALVTSTLFSAETVTWPELTRTDRLCQYLNYRITDVKDGFIETLGMQASFPSHLKITPREVEAVSRLWAALYMPKTGESRTEGAYPSDSVAKSLDYLGIHFVDRGEGYLELDDPLLGVNLLLSFDWPHLNRVMREHIDLLDLVCSNTPSKVVSRKDRDHRHFPVPLAMVHMDKMTNTGGKVNYGVAEHDGGYCVGMLRDLLTFSLTRTRILEGVSADAVEYRVEEIKSMMRSLMSYMKGSISDDDFADFCGKKCDSSETSKFEKALYAGLEIAEVGAIMTAEDEKIITDVWALIEKAVKTRAGIPVAEIIAWGRKLDDLFGRLGAKVGLEIPSGVYGPQFGVWADYTANGKGVYYFVPRPSSMQLSGTVKKQAKPEPSLRKTFIKRAGRSK